MKLRFPLKSKDKKSSLGKEGLKIALKALRLGFVRMPCKN